MVIPSYIGSKDCVCSFLAMTMHSLHIQFIYLFLKNLTIEKEKILIPFILLDTRLTSTPVPERDQLVHFFILHKLSGTLRDLTLNDEIHILGTYLNI